MRAILAFAALATLVACRTEEPPPAGHDAPAASATSASASAAAPASAPSASASASGARVQSRLAACRTTTSGEATVFTCPSELKAIDQRSTAHDSALKMAENVDAFAFTFVQLGAKRDDTELVAKGTHYKSVKLAGDLKDKGYIVARMIVVDRPQTRYLSCKATTDACDDVLIELLGRVEGSP
jgi:hypothetical protein